MKRLIHPSILAVLPGILFSAQLLAQPTAFTYQGSLGENGMAANGTYDVEFRLFDAAVGGTQVGVPLTADDVAVVEGRFSVLLDFGAAFDGSERFLELAVRPGQSTANYTTLTPRQALTSVPYAVRSIEASAVPPGTITGPMLADGAVTSAKIAPGAVSELGTPDGASTTALKVTTNGLVGIGTTNPAAGLHVTTSAPFVSGRADFHFQDGTGSWTNLQGVTGLDAAGLTMVVAAASDDAITVMWPPGLIQAQIRDGTGSFTNLNGAYRVALSTSGQLLAIAAISEDAITLADVTTPSNPQWRAVLRHGFGGFNDLAEPTGVAISGNLLAISARVSQAVTLVNISNPSSPTLQTVLRDGTFGFNSLADPHGVAFNGNLLAVAARDDDAVSLIDTANPSNPVLRSVLHLPDAYSLAFSGSLLAAGGLNGRVVILADVTDPANPEIKSVLSTTNGFDRIGYPIAVTLSSNLLAIATLQPSGVMLVDVTEPSAPRLLGRAVSHEDAIIHEPQAVKFANDRLWVVGFNALTGLSFTPSSVALSASGRVGIGTAVPLAPLHVAGDFLVEGGQLAEIRNERLALGLGATATGNSSVAVGSYAQASGNAAFAAGYSAHASGLSSTAFGSGTQATTNYATAMGYLSTASGRYATAMGNETVASGQNSTAAGFRSEANGSASFAAGYQAIATGDSAVALGRNARALHDGSFVWQDAANSSSVLSSTTNNQFLIRASGGVGIGTNRPSAALHVIGEVKATEFTGSGAGLTNVNAATLQGLTATQLVRSDTASTLNGNLTVNGALSANNLSAVGATLSGSLLAPIGTAGSPGIAFNGDADTGIFRSAVNQWAIATAGTERMRVTSNGIGIGEANPQGAVHVRLNSSLSNPQLHLFESGANSYARMRLTSSGKPYWDMAAGGANNVLNFFTSGGNGDVMTLATNGNLSIDGTLSQGSDRNRKENIQPVAPAEILEKVAALPISRWQYRGDETPHLGPMAQDFHAAFGLGGDDTHISSVDADGVALVAIQGLNQKLEEELKRRDQENAALKRELSEIKRLLTELNRSAR